MVDVDGDGEHLLRAFERSAPVLAQRIAERISLLEASTSPVARSLVDDISRQIIELVTASPDPEVSPTTEDGRRHLEQFSARVLRTGIPVENVLRGIRIALEEGMSLTDALADEVGIGAAARSELIRRLLAWSDLAMLTASETHHELTAAIPERLRRFGPLLTRLRSGQPTAEDLDAVSRLTRDAPRFALVARMTSAEGTTTVRSVDELVGREALVASVDDEVIALVADLPRRGGDVVAGVGPTAVGAGATESFRLADRALHTALGLGWTGIHRFDDLGVLPAVVADRDVGRTLVKRFLQPCRAIPGGAELISTVTEYLRSEANVARTAARLGIHENTLRYRLARFEELTHCTLRDTGTRAEIWWAITLP